MGLTFSYSWIITTIVNTINTAGLILTMNLALGMDPQTFVTSFVIYSVLMAIITY